jgi:hypothetical protein
MNATENGRTELGEPVGAHLEMKAEELFPVDPSVEEKSPFTFDTFRDPENTIPAWLYRRTEELTPGETIKLFKPAPEDTLKSIYKECDTIEGQAFVKKLGQIFPGVQPPTVRKIGWLKNLAMLAAERYLGMIPSAPAEYALKQLKAELETRIAHARQDTLIEMARHFRDLARKIEGSIVPGNKAPVREGKDYAGHRMLAVWARGGEPSEEPKF